MKYLLQVAILLIAMMVQLSHAWRSDRKPRIFGSKLRLKSLEPGKYRIQRKLVQFHNFFRSKVKPEASNMLAMSWSSAAAVDAQRWADACQLLVHDSSDGRTVEEYGPCGQNIFVSTHQVPWGNYLHTLSRPYERGAPCSACPGHCKAKKLCTNSCPYGDLWSNCKELDAAYHDWLCNTKTKEGLERFRFCKATCTCKDAIIFP
ncbi:cysteine-rich secretory protein 2-like [Penaeus chinensis]|uniref:cysteine-rich secretory protein 2-like n=1 Tax=Penaeus chinensis TaxID=139456 RepID=UPI001FB67452|nr:cysteine-rich secretory protein 2-like [Penaeus chinensis]